MRMLSLVLVVGLAAACASPEPGSEIIEHAAPWTLDRRPAPSDTVLHLTVMGGGCFHDEEEVGRIEVEETPDEVRLTPHIRKPGPPEDGCPAIGTAHPATVQLDAPLGERKVVNPETGNAVMPNATPSGG